MKRIIHLFIIIFNKFFFNNYSKNLLFLKNKFYIFLVIFYIHNFKYIYIFQNIWFLNNNNLFLF